MVSWRSPVSLQFGSKSELKFPQKGHQSVTFIDSRSSLGLKSREIKSENQLTSLTNFSETKMRNEKVRLVLEDYLRSKTYRDFEEYYVTGIKLAHYVPVSKAIFQMFEKILSLQKIEVYIVSNEVEDSAISVLPIEPGPELFAYAGILMKELRKFPYSFYQALDVRIMTFCTDTHLIKPRYGEIYARKYHNWLFMVGKHKTANQIRKHFYNTLCFNLVEKSEGLNEKWQQLNPQKPKKRERQFLTPAEILGMGYLNVKCYKSPLIDQFEVFEALMNNPREVMYHKDQIVAKKAKLLMEALCAVDPEGLSSRWWAEKELRYEPAEAEEGEFIFNNK